MLKRLERIILYVTDLEKSTAFYRDVLQLAVRVESATRSEFEVGGLILVLEPQFEDQEIDRNKRSGIVLGFQVQNMDFFYNLLKSKGVVFTEEPMEGEMERRAEFVDPDGYVFAMMG